MVRDPRGGGLVLALSGALCVAGMDIALIKVEDKALSPK